MDIQPQDKLATYREVVSAENAAPRGKMTDKAKAKLRALTEEGRLNSEADTRLVKAFPHRPWTLEQLVDLFAKSFGGVSCSPRRRAIKALYRLAQDIRVYRIQDISFLGELLPGEAESPMSQFLKKYPLPEDETFTPTSDGPEVRYCFLKRKCLKFKAGQPGIISGRGQYCSRQCQGRAKWQKKASKATPLIQESQMPSLAPA